MHLLVKRSLNGCISAGVKHAWLHSSVQARVSLLPKMNHMGHVLDDQILHLHRKELSIQRKLANP